MSKKEELQKKIIQFQILNTTLAALQEKAKIINQQKEELQKTKNAIEELKTINPNKALIPLGSGNFIYGRIDDTENIIVGVGAGVAIKKKRKEAIEILNLKLRELEVSMNDVTNQMQVLSQQLEKLQIEIEKLQK
jgi:prefoldin alpha subunit